MLRGLLGFARNDGTPVPPKGKIEVVCPTCGAVQYEPRLVVSTNCRKCGDHLRIEKKQVIGSGVRKFGEDSPPSPISVTPSKDPPIRSSVSEDKPATPTQAEPQNKRPPRSTVPLSGSSVLRSIISQRQPEIVQPSPSPSPEPEPKLEEEPQLTGQAPNLSEEPASTETPGEVIHQEAPPTRLGRRLSHQPPPTAAPPPASASTLQKMKDQGLYRQQYFKEVQCFDCGHAFKVGRSSRSANCPQCGSLISLEDIEINTNSTQSIKTRGDVIIRKPGHLSAALVQCRDLRCFGIIEANLECAGDAVFKSSGTMIGEVRCHRLVIEKGANVTFSNLVYADEVEIHSKVTATIFSRGAVLITAYGSVDGDVTARSVSIEPGGELNGAMNIIRADSLLFVPTDKSQ